MKKTLLLSVVASTMIMAGGDIAPVEPVVEAPAVEAAGWDLSGNAVVYYQTDDQGLSGATVGDLFEQGSSAADAGIQLRATNADVVAGIGAGVEVSGLATLSLERDVVSGVMQTANGDLHGGWISQAYLTYGAGNTSIKVGRQELPKALSPFAYSEGWNVFKNTFDAALLVNTDIANTTIVGAWVKANNVNGMAADMADFNNINEQDGVYLLTVQNKSIADLTLTGSYYYAADMDAFGLGTIDDLNILWGDAAYNAGNFNVAVQGGQITHDVAPDDITAFGAKIDTSVNGINLMAAYSDVQDGFMFQVGGTTSALYTNTVANQLVAAALEIDASKVVLGANTDALGGNIAAAYAMTDSDVSGDVNELDLVYSTNLTDTIGLTAAYVYVDPDGVDALNVVRVVGTYKF
jgi:hypothetical protein